MFEFLLLRMDFRLPSSPYRTSDSLCTCVHAEVSIKQLCTSKFVK